MATVLESFMAREAVPLKSVSEILLRVEMYLCKSYYKTASFIRYTYRSIALLGRHAHTSATAAAMEELGFHLGPAYQIQDDILDFKADASIWGKSALANMDLWPSAIKLLQDLYYESKGKFERSVCSGPAHCVTLFGKILTINEK